MVFLLKCTAIQWTSRKAGQREQGETKGTYQCFTSLPSFLLLYVKAAPFDKDGKEARKECNEDGGIRYRHRIHEE